MPQKSKLDAAIQVYTASLEWPQYSKTQLKEYRERYCQHRSRSRQCKIPFILTFLEWLKIWIDSGHLENRGRFRGGYVMARFSDQGAYKVGNVSIISHAENITAANRAQPRKGPRPNQSLAMRGRVKSPEHRAAISEAAKARWARVTRHSED